MPVAMLTVVFATSGRSMIARASGSHVWFEIGWDGDRLRIIGPLHRDAETTRQLPSIALVWFERLMLAGPRLTATADGIILSGPTSQVSFTAVRALTEWSQVAPARLRC
jgi:hypothetical protein